MVKKVVTYIILNIVIYKLTFKFLTVTKLITQTLVEELAGCLLAKSIRLSYFSIELNCRVCPSQNCNPFNKIYKTQNNLPFTQLLAT